MSGVEAVQARIAAIEARFWRPTPVRLPPTRSFAAELQQATEPSASHTERLRLARLAETPLGDAAPGWAARLPATAAPWVDELKSAAAENGLDPRLLAAVAWTESGFDPSAISRSGAIGLMQLMPETAEYLGVDPLDPVENLRGGARFLADQIDRFGRIDLALAAYNAGPGNVDGQIPPFAQTLRYVGAVLDRAHAL